MTYPSQGMLKPCIQSIIIALTLAQLPDCAQSTQGINPGQEPFHYTWMESGKRRLLFCQRTLVPQHDLNREPCDPLASDVSAEP